MPLESMLVVITVLSVLIAGATSLVLMRRLREERLRSDARVALLRDLSTDQHDLLLRPEGPSQDRSEIFHVTTERTPWRGRFVGAGLMAVLVVTGTWTWMSFSTSTRTPNSTSPAAAADAALELLSLRHTQEEQDFVVTGLVQNPRGGTQLVRVEATVLLFDSRGTMLTSGRAPIDFTTLAAGDESPFLIRVPVSGAVARYRVGFRRADGQVLGHVDRRNHESVAQRQEP
jgi:hypothetical protein